MVGCPIARDINKLIYRDSPDGRVLEKTRAKYSCPGHPHGPLDFKCKRKDFGQYEPCNKVYDIYIVKMRYKRRFNPTDGRPYTNTVEEELYIPVEVYEEMDTRLKARKSVDRMLEMREPLL